MKTIDGSQGEGGGQILRSSLALSICTGTPFRIEKIRAGRAKPGLLRQHLTAVNAAVEICGAQVSGATLSSRELTFTPGQVRPGGYHFAVGTAGSATLVLQTVLPPLLLASGPSTITVEGGTHNPHAPPFHFLERSFLPLINRMGPNVTATLERYGFYPAGGGRIVVTIEPSVSLTPLDLTKRGEIKRRKATAIVAGLPAHIGQRELQTVQRMLNWSPELHELEEVDADQGPGNALLLEIAGEHVTEVISGFGSKGIRSEDVAKGAIGDARRYLAANVAVGEHLADQLLLPFALARGGAFETISLSRHSTTNIDVIGMFLDVRIETEKIEKQRWRVTVAG